MSESPTTSPTEGITFTPEQLEMNGNESTGIKILKAVQMLKEAGIEEIARFARSGMITNAISMAAKGMVESGELRRGKDLTTIGDNNRKKHQFCITDPGRQTLHEWIAKDDETRIGADGKRLSTEDQHHMETYKIVSIMMNDNRKWAIVYCILSSNPMNDVGLRRSKANITLREMKALKEINIVEKLDKDWHLTSAGKDAAYFFNEFEGTECDPATEHAFNNGIVAHVEAKTSKESNSKPALDDAVNSDVPFSWLQIDPKIKLCENAARLEILMLLAGGGPLNKGELAKSISIGAGNLSNHVRKLNTAGLTEVAEKPSDRLGSFTDITESGIAMLSTLFNLERNGNNST